jgi:VWFA-related protein
LSRHDGTVRRIGLEIVEPAIRVRMSPKSSAGVVAVLSVLAVHGPSAGAQQPPVFKARVDVVTVDATVVDRDGRPVEGLQAKDFAVTVDGRPRRIVTVEFTRFDQRPTGPEPSPAAAPGRDSTPAGRSTGPAPGERLIMLAFDHSSFYATGTRSATLAGRRFLATLGPADRVGLVSFPQTGIFIAPTTDRAVVERELGRVTGTAVRPTTDGRPFVSIAESAVIRGGDQFTLDRVRARECAGLPPDLDQACVYHIEMVAREHVIEAQEQTSQSLRGLGNVLDRLGALPGRKVMVLISGGLVTSLTRSGESSSTLLAQVASRAAAANVAIHVMHVDTGVLDAIDADHRRVSDTIVTDHALQSAGLKDIAASTGGDLMTVVGDANFAFDRVTRTISAAYVLGIETEPAERDGRPHSIGVKVRRPGVRVMSRQQFRMAAANATVSSPADRVSEALRTGRVSTDLPLRVAVFRMKEIETGRVRALVRVDAGRGVAGPAELTVGMAFVGDAGRASQSEVRTQPLPSSAGPDPAWVLQTVVPLDPGDYTVRVAMTDPDGRLGSANVRLSAAVPQGPGASHSDLMLYDPARFGAGGPAPLIDGRVVGTEVSAVFEVYPSGSSPVTQVEFSLAKAGGPPEQTWLGRLTREVDGAVVAGEADFDLSDLLPGEYTVTATAMAATRELARATAMFKKER